MFFLVLLRWVFPSNQPFLLSLICCGYANYNVQGAFVITFLICSGLLNFLRSFSTIVIRTKSLLQAAIFAALVFMCCAVCTATPEISSSSKNISNTARVTKLSSRFYDYDANKLVANRISASSVFKQVISSKIKRKRDSRKLFSIGVIFAMPVRRNVLQKTCL